MYKLTPWVLFFIFSGVHPSLLSVQAETAGEMTPQAFLNRSYQPELIYYILSRPTGRAQPEDSLPGQEPQILPGRPRQGVAHLPPPLAAEPAPPPAPASGLNGRVLGQLKRFDSHIQRYSRMYGVEPNLTRVMIYVESAGNTDAISPKGALGLMQLMPGTAAEMGVSNPLGPVQNIFGGTRYIGSLINRFEYLDLALWAYNAGLESVKRKRLPRETKRYIPEVLRIKSILDRGGV